MEPAKIIPDKLFYKIGEVCDHVGVQPHVLRYWESEFPMLAPQKNRAGQRVYRRKDLEIVLRIRELLYDEKFTIAGAKRKLAEELRGGGGAARLKVVTPDMEPAEAAGPPLPDRGPSAGGAGLSPHAKRSIKRIRRELEALLTMLGPDGIKPDRR
jgi:DNA-binding transcriptional MerR regulator